MKYKLIMLCIWAACAIAGLISMVQMLWSIVVGSPKAWRLAKAFDRVGNAATGGDDSNEPWRMEPNALYHVVKRLVSATEQFNVV